MSEDEVDVADLLAHGRVVGAEAEARELVGAEMSGDGLEAVVAAAGPVFAVAESAKLKIKVIADHKNVLGGNFVEVGEGLDGLAGFVVEGLRFDEDGASLLQPDGAEFGLLPVKLMDFGVKIQRQEAEVVAGEVVLSAGITEADDETHIYIIKRTLRFCKDHMRGLNIIIAQSCQ